MQKCVQCRSTSVWSYVGFSCGPVYISQKSWLVCYMWVQIYICWFTNLLVHFTGECKSIKEFFSSINEPVYKKPRKKMTDDFKSQEYTDPRCMRLIKERDKDANPPYMKEFHDELRKNIKIRNKKL